MNSRTWKEAVTRETKRLAGIGRLPESLHGHAALRAMGFVCTLALAQLETQLIANSVEVKIVIRALRSPDRETRGILRLFEVAIAGPAKGERGASLSPEEWINCHDYDGFIAATINGALPDSNRATLLREVSVALAKVTSALHTAQDAHLRAIANRDVPPLAGSIGQFTPSRIRWLLAVDHDGRPERPQVLIRRTQALTTYAAVAEILEEPPVTAAIDAGRPLTPILTERLGLCRAGVRALVGARTGAEAMTEWKDWQKVITALTDHEVPAHEWPGGGQPNQAAAWVASAWLHYAGHGQNVSTLIRADYHGADPAQVRDAVEAFRADLLRPLLSEQLRLRGRRQSYAAECFARSMEGDWTADGIAMRDANCRSFLAIVRNALIGPRRPKRFQEAAALWHRRAATLAALRDERRSDRPGWPALCDAWRSRCGRYAIVPLTSTKALVEEGQAHDHCVGGYYDQCRRGDTQILSLRRDGKPAATIEVLLGDDWRVPQLTIGQFKGFRDRVADAGLHPVLSAFLADLRRGAHTLNARKLATYRKWARDHVTPWSGDALPLDHARTAYPFYRVLMPRPAPETFDAWIVSSGLAAGLDVLIDRMFPTQAQHTRRAA